MERLHSYSSSYRIGHKILADIFTPDCQVVIEEKIDGSQFTFGVDENGHLLCRSTNLPLDLSAPEQMFQKAIEMARSVQNKLTPGWQYVGEYLQKEKHNALRYNRIPYRNFIGFDIRTGVEDYLTPGLKWAEFTRLGLETVPLYYSGTIPSMTEIKEYLTRESVLGGRIEGVVIKCYDRFISKKMAFAKLVQVDFQEVNAAAQRELNPSGKDVIGQAVAAFKTEARWKKAVQHLKESGEAVNAPQDIPALMKLVNQDLLADQDEIKQMLFDLTWKQIAREVGRGLPEWYKELIFDEL